MLITKLVTFAQTHNLVDDPLFETKPVNWVLSVSDGGRFKSVVRVGDSKRGTPFLVPKQVGRNSGARPAFGTDNARFVLGLSGGDALDTVYRDAFAAMVASALAQYPAEGLAAAVAFYEDASEVVGALDAARSAGVKASDVVAVAYASDPLGRFLSSTDEGKAFWRSFREAQDGSKALGPAVDCLSCGVRAPASGTADTLLKLGAVGGNPTGSALISYDAGSFESHRLSGNANAAVCEPCSQAYTRALNHLLKRDNAPTTRIDEGGVAFVIWADDDQAAGEVVAAVELPDAEKLARFRSGNFTRTREPANPDSAARILSAPRSGQAVAAEPDARLYVLGLRGNGGRAVVVDWFDVALQEAHENIVRWFADIQIQLIFDQKHTHTDRVTKVKASEIVQHAGSPSGPIPRWMLARATVRDGEDVPKRTGAALIRAALVGDPLPLTMAEAILERLRHEENGFGDYFAPARIGLLRCVLNRLPGQKGTLDPMLDPTATHPAYVCGRLLATLEAVQYQGVGDVGATVIDRFYGRASTAPRLVFGQLVALAQAHLGAINNAGIRINLEKEIEQITGLLEPEFPSSLSVEDQGRFAIGYWHQKAHRMAEIRERREARLIAEAAANAPQGDAS